MIYGIRIRQARESLGLTQKELAERIEIKQPTLAQMENGLRQPSAETLSALAFKTGFPQSFFRKASEVEFPLGSLLYRARTAATQRNKAKAHRYAELLFEASENFASRLSIPAVRLPHLVDAPEICAQITRATFGLSPDTPVPNLVHLLEKAGIRVLMLPIEMPDQDAFCVWVHTAKAQKPLIALTSGNPSDRMRFSIAHELGHLVMHQEVSGRLTDIEDEANLFASELLLPEDAIRAEIIPPVTLTGIAKFKPRWRVSIAALIQRVYRLKIITERQFKYLRKQLAANGMLKREPPELDVPPEPPRAFPKMAELLYGNPINYRQMINDTCLSGKILRAVLEGETVDSPSFVNSPVQSLESYRHRA